MAGNRRQTSAVSRLLLVGGAATLLVLLVVSSAAFALTEIEGKAMAAAEAEGLGLLRAVSTGVERSIEASRTVENLLAARLRENARDLEPELEGGAGREERVLRSFVVSHGLKGAVLLTPEFRVKVAVDGSPPAPISAGPPSPLSTSRLTTLVTDDLIRRVRAEGLGRKREVVLGFGENPFRTGVEFLVGVRLARMGDYLLLRQDAERLAKFRREEGVERYLADAAGADGISYLLLQGPDGRVLAASDPKRVGETLPIPTGGPVWRDGADGRVLDVGLPATFAGEPAGTLRVGLNGTPVERVIDRGRRSVLWFAALTLLFGAGGGIGLFAMDRARHRREEAHRQELRTREQAAAMGRLSAAVAHEVRSPLNAIGMAAQRMERESGAPEPNCARIREIAAAARREVGRINRIVEDFLDLGRGHPLERGAVELAGLVEEVVLAEDPRARREPPPSPVTARVDREELRKALANLMRNARQAAGEGAVVVAWRRDGAGVELEVRDSGPGVPAEEREQVFEHFYTGRPGGTGLGLAVARTAAMRHGGRIMLDDAPEGGARFVLWIPDRESD